MTRFALGGDEDGEGEGSRRGQRPKGSRLEYSESIAIIQQQQQRQRQQQQQQQQSQQPQSQPQQQSVAAVVDDEEEEDEEEADDEEELVSGSGGDVAEEDSVSEEEEEEENEEEGEEEVEEDEQEEEEITVVPEQQQLIPESQRLSRRQMNPADQGRFVLSLGQNRAGTAQANNPQVSSSASASNIAGGAKEGGGAWISPAADGSSIAFNLVDPEVLDCLICYEPLTIPVFQCENGHIACSSCCTKSKNKCPSCSWPIGYNRCRAMEKVLEAIRVSCQNIKHGCKESMSYSNRSEHEKACMHSPCSCPLPSCKFVSSSKQLYQHFSSNHVNVATRFMYNCSFSITLTANDKFHVLQEQNDGILFILDKKDKVLGTLVSIRCIQPSFVGGFCYDLQAKTKGSSLKFHSFAKSTPGQINSPSKTCHVIIPCNFFDTCGHLKMDLRIWRSGL